MKRYNIILLLILLFVFPPAGSSQEPTVVLPIGHTGTVFYASLSPDGKKIVTASHDLTVKVWDAATGYLLIDIPDMSNMNHPQFSKDGKKILTISFSDGKIKTWNSTTGELINSFTVHKGVATAEFSPDEKKIITIDPEDNTAKVLDATTGTVINTLKGHSHWLIRACFSPDGKKILTGSLDSTTKVWDAVTGNLVTNFTDHHGGVLSAEFSPDSKNIVTSAADGTTMIWDANSGIPIVDLSKYSKKEIAAEFSPDAKKVLTISRDSVVTIWNAMTGSLISNAGGKGSKIVGATFSPDSKKVITASWDKIARLWDAATGTLLHTLKGHSSWLGYVSFSPDGKKIITGSWDNSAAIWNANSGSLVISLKGHSETLASASFSPDGKKVVTASWNNNAKIWDVNSGSLLNVLEGHQSRVISALFSPDGKKIVTASWDKTAKIWDASTGNIIKNLDAGDYQLSFAQFNPDGKKIITMAEDSTLKIWDASSGNLLTSFRKNHNMVSFIRFTEDAGKVLTISKDTAVNIWDLATGNLVTKLKGHTFWIMSARFSPDFKKVVTASWDKTAKVWDAETGKLLHTIQPGTGIAYAEFSPDGKRIVTGCLDSTAKIWDAETGGLLFNLKGHKEYIVRGTRFSPDGKKIIAISGDDIRIWDTETGKLLGDLKGHKGRIASAAFSADGKKAVTASWDKTVKLWNAETGELFYTSFAVDNSDYLVLDKFNHYDGTGAARKLIYLNCSGEVIELDQVKDQLWVPGLAQRIMDGETIHAQKFSDLNICNLTPVVDPLEQQAGQYRFRVTPRTGGLSTVILYVNNIEVKKYTPQQLLQQKGEYLLTVDKKELQKYFINNKENTVSAKALTAKNSISSRSAIIYEEGGTTSSASPNLYAIIVGVSNYKGDGLDLKFAAKDASDIAVAVETSARKLLNTDGKEHVFIYKAHTGEGRDRFPEKNGIRQLFTEIAGKTQPHDILLIFFAGHGIMEAEKNQFYFLTADASNATVSGALKNVGISTDELSDWIKPQVMKAQKRILIFDACNSGQIIKEMVSIGQKGQNLIASRGDEKSKQVKAIEKLNERSGMFILSASASDQKAYEMGRYNQGILTYSLLKAIKDQPDILEERKYLNISRWFNAAEKTVGELVRETGARQQPQIVSTTNFNIGMVDEEVRSKIVLPFEKPLFTRSDFRNTDLRIDNLKLRNLVEKELDDISGNNSSSILFSPDYDGVNVYAISGDYTITGDQVTASVLLTKGGTTIKTKFEVAGVANQPGKLAKSITVTVLEWLKNEK